MNGHACGVIPAPWIVRIDWLAILALVVGDTITVDLLRGHAHQRPLLQASYCTVLTVDGVVAYEEFVVALVVHVHANVKLNHAARHKDTVRILNFGHVIAVAGPLVPVAADAEAIPAMRARSSLALIEHVPSGRIYEVAMACGEGRSSRQDHYSDYLSNGHHRAGEQA